MPKHMYLMAKQKNHAKVRIRIDFFSRHNQERVCLYEWLCMCVSVSERCTSVCVYESVFVFCLFLFEHCG